MLGVGIDYAIQMHSRIEEEVIIDRSPHPIQEAARALGGPMLVVTVERGACVPCDTRVAGPP